MRSLRKIKLVKVIRDKTDKTLITVETKRSGHPKYKKVTNKKKKFMVHDSDNSCKKGDLIFIMETRPVSKNKRWRFHKFYVGDRCCNRSLD